VPAAAEWHFSPMVGLTFKGATNIIDNELATTKVHRHLAGAVSLLGEGILGAEGVGSWMPGFFQADDKELVESSRTATLMGNVMVTTPRRWTEYILRPYFSGGFGLVHATVTQTPVGTGSALPPVRLNASGYNLGVGAIGFLSERTGVRFDLRYYSTMRRNSEVITTTDPDSAYLRYMTASVGIVWRR
jgi:hypothetical protein